MVLLEAVIPFPVNILFLSERMLLLLLEELFNVGTLPPPPPPLPSAPSPVPTDSSSMVEGLLHPRLGMALGSSQQASATSLRDHEDYTRPINGVCVFVV